MAVAAPERVPVADTWATTILAIDPGSEQSAWVLYGTASRRPTAHGIWPNAELLGRLRNNDSLLTIGAAAMVIEWMQPRGRPTSAQEMETLYWIGRFVEAAEYGARSSVPWPVHRLPRLKVKMALCGFANAKDGNIIAALVDRFGGVGGRRAAVGVKAQPGPLYGITNDRWQALALAVAWADLQAESNR
jgi:hypothetical protein